MTVSIQDYNTLHDIIVRPVNDPHINELLQHVGETVQLLRDNYEQVAFELLGMYESASEHNIDVSRRAVLNLAQRMLGVE